jgi:anti-anti-sigma factor
VVEEVIVPTRVPDDLCVHPSAHRIETRTRRAGSTGTRGPTVLIDSPGPLGEKANMWPHPDIPVPLPGSITIEDEGDHRVLCLRGELDAAVVVAFESAQRAEAVVVDAIDAGAVTFISSRGIAVMLLSAEASRAAGRVPVLRASSHQVDRLLRMSGIEDVFRRPHDDGK